MKKVTKSEAIEQGLNYYFTGKPCKHGHVSERYINGGACVACQRIKSKEFSKNNVESERIRKHLDYLAHKEERNDRNKSWQKRNRAKVSAYVAKWREKNREKVNERAAELRRKNPEKQKEADRRWRAKNKHKVAKKDSLKRAAKLARIPVWFGEFDDFVIQEAHALAALRGDETGIPWHVDHMLPMRGRKISGLHCAHNIQVIPAAMNVRKINKMVLTNPLEWLRDGV